LKSRICILRQSSAASPAQQIAKEAIMSPEERQLLSSLFDRVRAAAPTPRDSDAEAFISQAVKEQPYAPYFLAQAVIMQEQGMKAAAEHIQQLEARVHELEQQGAGDHQQSQQSGGFLGGLGSLFGGQSAPRGPAQAGGYAPQQQGRLYDDYARNAPPPQQSAGPWGQQPTGPWSQQPSMPSAGGSFLRGALGTAAGVAGGVMLADSLRSLFSPHLGGFGGIGSGLGGAFGSGQQPVEETVVNNYYGDDANNQNDNNQDDNVVDTSDDQNDDYTNDDDFSADDGSDDSFNV
jgi:hypothetical protein